MVMVETTGSLMQGMREGEVEVLRRVVKERDTEIAKLKAKVASLEARLIMNSTNGDEIREIT